MYCCAADAKPIGVSVQFEKAETLNRGDWVKVEGTVGFTDIEDDHVPKIMAQKMEPISPPKDQYLTP
jgi:uncharacterized membrane protein YcgQ (UPF0703/DUF1980 family)